MQQLLTFIYSQYIGKEKVNKDEIIIGLLKRTYFFGKDAFGKIENQQRYPGLMRLTEQSKRSIEHVLARHSGDTQIDIDGVTTLYDILIEQDTQSVQP